jgi:hypothetical protein
MSWHRHLDRAHDGGHDLGTLRQQHNTRESILVMELKKTFRLGVDPSCEQDRDYLMTFAPLDQTKTPNTVFL